MLRKIRTILLLALFASPLHAQPISEQRVQFETGSSGAVIDGSIKGEAIVDYLLGAKAGQRMTIGFETDNPSAYFNLLPGNEPTALHIGSAAGNRYDGTLIRSGDYRIRVFLMRNAARRAETANYTLNVSIDGEPASGDLVRDPDFADGLSGGPDWWQVTGLTEGGTLNVRSAAGTDNANIGALGSGDKVRNLGCEMNGSTKWCRVEVPGDQTLMGWVAGRFLTEAARPSAAKQPSGMIPCAVSTGQPMGSCNFRVTRHGSGTANVWVTLPSGGERYLDFSEGMLIGSDPGKEMHQERSGDLNLIYIDGVERYELPDAVLYGG